MPKSNQPPAIPPVTAESIAAAKAAAAAERAPFDFQLRVYERRREERRMRDAIAGFAAFTLYGKRSVDSLTPDQRRKVEGSAMALVRRQELPWTVAALKQAEQCLLDEDSLRNRGLFWGMDRQTAERFAQQIVAVVFYAFVGTLEIETSAKTEVYRRLEEESR